MDYLAILSLVFLIGAIVLGFTKNLNVGLVSLGLSLVLGTIGGISAKDIVAGFPTSLFITLFGTMLFFGILEKNGTIDLLSKKFLRLVGGKAFLMPIAVLLLSYFLAAIGPGAITVLAIMQGLVVVLSVRVGLPAVLMSTMSSIGACTGSFTPIAISGIIARDLSAKQGITGMEWRTLAAVSAINLLAAIIVYFIFKGHKLKFTKHVDNTEKIVFNDKQKISLLVLLVLIVAVIGFGLDIGLVSFTLAVVLIILNAGTQKEALASVPWGTLVLITGVGVIMQITLKLGGIKLLANVLSTIMTPSTAPALLSLSASIMSLFSSALGVVLPTLIPTVPMLVQNLGGDINPMLLIIAVCAGAPMAAISPLSTGGALSLAAYVQNAEDGDAGEKVMFKILFKSAFACVVVTAILNLIGVSKLFF